MSKIKDIIFELKEHSPFTAISALVIILISLIIPVSIKGIGGFYFLHPLHVFFSAIASSAIFWKYTKKIWLALIVGIIGAVVIGSTSDVMMPYVFAFLAKANVSFHLGLIDKPFLVIGAGLVGAFIGILYRKIGTSKLGHSGHVLVSTAASLAYFRSFSSLDNLILLFIFVFLAVIIPCCSSDIIYPILVKR